MRAILQHAPQLFAPHFNDYAAVPCAIALRDCTAASATLLRWSFEVQAAKKVYLLLHSSPREAALDPLTDTTTVPDFIEVIEPTTSISKNRIFVCVFSFCWHIEKV